MSLRFNILSACFVALCCAARADYVHPYLSEGEVYTNTMMLDIFYAAWERQDCFADPSSAATNKGEYMYAPPRSLPPFFTVDYEMYSGTTSTVTVVTNGAYVITNTLPYPTYDTVTLTNIDCFLPYDQDGLTGTPHVVRSMFAIPPFTIAGLLDDYLYEDQGDLLEFMGEAFVAHWEADSNGLFNGWFSDGKTGVASGMPISTSFDFSRNTLPVIWDMGYIMSYTNVGWVLDPGLNSYGQIFDSRWYFTRSPPTTQNWNLADMTFLNDVFATNFLDGAGDGFYQWDSEDGRWEGGDGGEYDIHSVYTNGRTRFVLGQETGGGFDEDYFIGDIGRTNWLALPYVTDLGLTNNTDSIAFYTNTASLAYRLNTPLDFHHLEEDVFPSFVFTSGGDTNPLLSATAAITGQVFRIRTNRDSVLSLTYGEVEFVTLATNDVVLTNRWQSIDAITLDSGTVPAVGHAWSVVYDSEVTLYAADPDTTDWILTANDHNERRSVLDCLRWTYDDRSESTFSSFVEGSNRVWQGTSASSWAAAVSACEASTPNEFSNSTLIQRWTTGTYDGTTWVARASSGRVKREVTGPTWRNNGSWMSPKYEHQIDLYAIASDARVSVVMGHNLSTNGTHTFDAFADEAWILGPDKFYGITNVYTGYGTTAIVGTPYDDVDFIGSLDFPDTWCVEPDTNAPSSRGFIIEQYFADDLAKTLAVIKWDATTNGFQFIRN